MSNEHITDEQIVAELERAGVKFQRFMGGITGTKECWSTAGSQDVRKLAAGVRALLALRPAAQPAVDHDVLHDSAWIAGAKFGWNCGATGDSQQLNESINARIKQRVDAKANDPQHQPAAHPEVSDEVIIATTPEKPVQIGPRMTWHGDTVTAAQPASPADMAVYNQIASGYPGASMPAPKRECDECSITHDPGMCEQAAQPVGEPIYQHKMADGSWIDQTKQSYDYNVKNGHSALLRVVYTTPQPVAVPDGKPLGYLPQWAVDRLTGEMGAVADPVTWGLHAPIMAHECESHVAIYTAPRPAPPPKRP